MNKMKERKRLHYLIKSLSHLNVASLLKSLQYLPIFQISRKASSIELVDVCAIVGHEMTMKKEAMGSGITHNITKKNENKDNIDLSYLSSSESEDSSLCFLFFDPFLCFTKS